MHLRLEERLNLTKRRIRNLAVEFIQETENALASLGFELKIGIELEFFFLGPEDNEITRDQHVAAMRSFYQKQFQSSLIGLNRSDRVLGEEF